MLLASTGHIGLGMWSSIIHIYNFVTLTASCYHIIFVSRSMWYPHFLMFVHKIELTKLDQCERHTTLYTSLLIWQASLSYSMYVRACKAYNSCKLLQVYMLLFYNSCNLAFICYFLHLISATFYNTFCTIRSENIFKLQVYVLKFTPYKCWFLQLLNTDFYTVYMLFGQQRNGCLDTDRTGLYVILLICTTFICCLDSRNNADFNSI